MVYHYDIMIYHCNIPRLKEVYDTLHLECITWNWALLARSENACLVENTFGQMSMVSETYTLAKAQLKWPSKHNS